MTAMIITPESLFRSDREADAVAFIIGGLAEMACPLAPQAGGDPCQHPSGSCKPEGCSAC